MAMTHAERAARRKEMAEAVLTGKTLAEVSQQFNVCVATVGLACEEQGVPLQVRKRTWDVVAALLNSDDPIKDVAARLDMSRQSVYCVAWRMRKAGIAMPKRRIS